MEYFLKLFSRLQPEWPLSAREKLLVVSVLVAL